MEEDERGDAFRGIPKLRLLLVVGVKTGGSRVGGPELRV